MIRITDKSLCTGCTACVNICPAQCIVMRRDREGFDYPVANPDLCIRCGRCESVCPVLSPADEAPALSSYAVRSDEYVDESSSGGVFPALAEKVISAGGVVYGAVLQDDMIAGHMDAHCMSEIKSMRGSKYVQSDMYSVFEEVREYLADGRKVMFCGTPCQVAGLNACLGSQQEGLLTVDTACHGVPSPGLWEKYCRSMGESLGGKITDVRFRDKSAGWKRYSFRMSTDKGGIYKVPYMNDPYMALFIQGMTLRPSCYKCPARNGRSRSDLTLADLWKVAEVAPEMDDDRGTSLVVARTAKGLAALDGLGVRRKEVCLETASAGNSGFAEDVHMPERRADFFAGLHSAKDIVSYMKGFVVRKPLPVIWYAWIHTKLSKIKKRILK